MKELKENTNITQITSMMPSPLLKAQTSHTNSIATQHSGSPPRLTATDRFLYDFAWRRFVRDCDMVFQQSGKQILRLGD